MADIKIAKLPKEGHGLVVQLPPEFRFEGDEVLATRDEVTGSVTLSPRRESWEEFFAFRDAQNISDEEADEFARIMEEIVADRANHVPDPRGIFADELDDE
ncbi:MAG TPA: hypothetical protein VNZ55_13325 [Thermomicrobiales bacterium]|nr:hypothetical protein [Thermomicrobiales bacterium]